MKTAYSQNIDLSWVDEFVRKVQPYIFVRLEDNLLIKRPNHAVKLNPTGAKILQWLLAGNSIAKMLQQIGYEPQKMVDIANFMQAVRDQLQGSLIEFTANPAVATEPLTMNFSKFPVLSEVALTYRCNLRCGFCYAGCNCTSNPANDHREMSIAESKRLLWKLRYQAQVPSVSFTGGEPTLIPQLPELVAYAKSLDMRVNLITNGTLITPKLAKDLSAGGLDSAQVSLEGVTPATHHKMVRSAKAYHKTLAAVELLKQAGIHTHTNTTITQVNLHECVQFPAFVKQKFGNDKFSMNLMIPTGSGAVHDNLLVKYSEIGNYLLQIIAASEQHNVEFMWYSPVPMCMFNTIINGLGNKGCSACDGLISIGANGDVLPCASFDDRVGNLLSEDFQAIWHSQQACDYRNKLLAPDLCKDCENFHICNGACPLYWRHTGTRELQRFEARNQ